MGKLCCPPYRGYRGPNNDGVCFQASVLGFIVTLLFLIVALGAYLSQPKEDPLIDA